MKNITLNNLARKNRMTLASLLLFLAVGMAVGLVFAVVGLTSGSVDLPKEAQYVDIAVMSVIFAASAAAGVVFLVQAKRSPQTIEIKWSKFVQSLAPDCVPNPIKKLAMKRTIMYLFSVIVVVIAFVVAAGFFGEGSGFWLTLAGGVVLFAVATVLLIVSMRPLRARQISMFDELYNFKPVADFIPDAEYAFDLMNHSSCAFGQNGFAIKRTPSQVMLNGTAADPFEEFSGEFSIGYDEVELYAEAFYRNWGDMMSVYVIAEFKSGRKAFDALNFLYAADESEKLEEGTKLDREEFPFFMFKLDEKLYNKLKYFGVEVKEMDAILTNRTENMTSHCKNALSNGAYGGVAPNFKR